MLTGKAGTGALSESECKGTAIFGTDQMFWEFFLKKVNICPKLRNNRQIISE